MVTTSPQIIIPKTPPADDRGWWDTLERNIRLGIGREKVLQEAQMQDAAKAEREIERRTVNGLGQLKMVIPTSVYLQWHLSNPGCWNDKKFKADFYRDNEACRASRPVKKYY